MLSTMSRRAFALAPIAAAIGATMPLSITSAQAAGETPRTGYEYLALGDFTINLPNLARRRSFVVVSVTIEAAAAEAQAIRARTPRLREAALHRLLSLSEQGRLTPGSTDPLVIKDNVLDAVTRVQPSGVHDVLITRLLHS